jgi:hypothetical protein
MKLVPSGLDAAENLVNKYPSRGNYAQFEVDLPGSVFDSLSTNLNVGVDRLGLKRSRDVDRTFFELFVTIFDRAGLGEAAVRDVVSTVYGDERE